MYQNKMTQPPQDHKIIIVGPTGRLQANFTDVPMMVMVIVMIGTGDPKIDLGMTASQPAIWYDESRQIYLVYASQI
jgi:hypothetical protein